MAWALDGHVQVEDEGELRPAAPGDILILTWQREPLISLAAALEARRVPFDITGSRGAFGVPEIRDTLKLLGSLADPDNPVALVGVLISPLFGHSDQALWDFRKAGGSFRFLGAGHLERPLAEHPVATSLAKQSDLWRRAISAPERHTEVSFSLTMDGTELGRQLGQVLVSGVIDLAFREGDRWHLVDYKTDRIAAAAEIQEDQYARQLRLYGQAWHQVSGCAASEVFLFFIDACAAHRIA